jgi:hypothetical protein
MKFYKEYAVTIATTRSATGKTAPTGFLTPYEDNAAGHSRIATAERWASGNKAIRLPNVSKSGFRVASYVTRYRSDNKLSVIEDPRGFQVEISIKNLHDLIDNTTIINGVFQADLIWLRDKNVNHLAIADDDNHKKAVRISSEKLVAAAGDYIIASSYNYEEEYLYLGKKYVQCVGLEYDYLPAQPHTRWSYYKPTPQIDRDKPLSPLTVNDGKWHVYLSVGGNKLHTTYYMSRSPKKVIGFSDSTYAAPIIGPKDVVADSQHGPNNITGYEWINHVGIRISDTKFDKYDVLTFAEIVNAKKLLK